MLRLYLPLDVFQQMRLPLLEERVLELNDRALLCCNHTILQSNHLPETICGEVLTKSRLPAQLSQHIAQEHPKAAGIPTALQLLGAETMKTSQSSFSLVLNDLTALIFTAREHVPNTTKSPRRLCKQHARQRPARVCKQGGDVQNHRS